MPRGVKRVVEEVVSEDIQKEEVVEQVSEVKIEPIKKESKPVNGRAEKFPEMVYIFEDVRRYVERDSNGQPKEVIEKKDAIKPEYQKGIYPMKIRTARHYNVTIEHFEKSYELLNGKKLDGFLVSDIMDRLGFSYGQCESRADLSERYGKNNIKPMEIAEKKIIAIVQKKNPLAAYNEYIKNLKIEIEHKIDTDAIYGE